MDTPICLTISNNEIDMYMDDFREAKLEKFCRFQKNMEENVKTLSAVCYDNRKKHLGRKYNKLLC